MTARKVLDKAMTEADLQSVVIEYAHLKGWRVHHDRGDYRQCIAGDPGFPDLVLARSGRMRFFEVKTDKGKLTVEQRTWAVALDACDSEDDDWEFLVDDPKVDVAYAVIRPSRWSSGLIQKVLA